MYTNNNNNNNNKLSWQPQLLYYYIEGNKFVLIYQNAHPTGTTSNLDTDWKTESSLPSDETPLPLESIASLMLKNLQRFTN